MSSESGNAETQGADPTRAKSTAKDELGKLKFELNNQSMAKLPANLTVERRPLIHAPIASPFAGPGVQKVVYVSRNTPVMAAVKRVKKLLLHIEKRAMQDVDLTKDRNGMRKLAEANEKLGKNGEAVLVRASGRAMEQALRVGEWFKTREEELVCNVEVCTGNVQAVDDIVEKEGEEAISEERPEGPEDTSAMEGLDTSLMSASEGGKDTTRLNIESSDPVVSLDRTSAAQKTVGNEKEPINNAVRAAEMPRKRRRRGKRRIDVLDENTSARIRWVKTVEVAISLKC